jgi:dTDP-4-amino-4,6-dideoxygalactose transaminase
VPSSFFAILGLKNPLSLNACESSVGSIAFKGFMGAHRYKATSETYFNKILHVPCRQDLTDDEVNLIVETIKKALLE